MTLTMMDGVACVLAVAFVIAGCLNLTGPSFVKDEFRAWGYPGALRWFVGLLELGIAALVLLPEWRVAAACAAIAVLVGVLVSLARSRAWLRMEYPVVLMALFALLALAP